MQEGQNRTPAEPVSYQTSSPSPSQSWPSRLLLIFLAAIFLLAASNFDYRRTDGLVESAASAGNLPVFSSIVELEERPRLKSGQPAALELSAKSAVVYDLEAGRILFSKNIEEQLPIASLTKLTTALLVSRNLSPGAVITVSPEAVNNVPSPSLGLIPGEQITAGALVEGMLVASANDAAQVLAEAVGGSQETAVVMLNSLASNLGLKRTQYANPTGFDNPKAYSTALDLLAVVFEIHRTPWLMDVLSETTGMVSSVDGTLVHSFRTTNQLLRTTDYVTGGKTGYTDEAKGNLVVFADVAGSSLAGIIIGSDNREQEMSALLTWIFNSYEF